MSTLDGMSKASHRNAGRRAPLTGRNVELDIVVQVGRVQFSEMLRSLVSLNYGHYHYRMFLGGLGCQ